MPTSQEFHQQLDQFSSAFNYDVTYLREMLDSSLPAYEAFAPVQGMAGHRSVLPVEAHAVACVTTMLSEDCGPCTQLQLQMAAQAGVDRSVLKALIEDPASLPTVLRDVHEHARAVAGDAEPDDARMERLRQAFGTAGLAELGLAVAGSRVFPTLKRALGHAKACHRPSLDF